MKVFSPDGGEGGREFLGYFPVSVSYRTAEEIGGGDVRYTNLRLAAYAPKHRAPEGGYTRGMILATMDGSEEYRVLVPSTMGRNWILRLEAILFEGDGLRFEEKSGMGVRV